MKTKKILSFVAMGLIALAFFVYMFAPVLEFDYSRYSETMTVIDLLEDDAPSTICVTIVFIIACFIGALVSALNDNNVVKYVFGGISILTAIFCFAAKEFILDDQEINSYNSYFELGGGAVFAGLLLIAGAVLLFVSATMREGVMTMSSNNSTNPNERNVGNQQNNLSAEDKQNNLIRFLLTFFLGWIGSLVINHSTLKPRGFSSRTLAYVFLSMVTFGIYGLVASICNLSFDPAQVSNVGYFRDGTDGVAATYAPSPSVAPVQTNTEYAEQKPQLQQESMEKKFEYLQTLKKLLDDGIVTQEEFDAKKKEILGL